MILNLTVFNENYMTKQIQHSDVASQINQNIDQQTSKLGLQNTNLVGSDLINQVLKNMVHQFYQGETVQVDNNLVTNQVEQSLGSNTGILQQGITGMVVSGVVQAINTQINSEKISSYSKTMSDTRRINSFTETAAFILLAVCMILALIKKALFRISGVGAIFSGLLGAILFGFAYVGDIPAKLITNNSVAVQIGNQVVKDITSTGFLVAVITAVTGILLYGIGRFIKI
ncbi:hypothetical protein IV79_GL001541 [Pediococcus claussenii]|nr:hypothetical protein IV79_GL001541 [Pediococcus claussenii]